MTIELHVTNERVKYDLWAGACTHACDLLWLQLLVAEELSIKSRRAGGDECFQNLASLPKVVSGRYQQAAW